MLVADKARDGHVVARLKWGDPFVFDSGAKEALFLHEQGVPFEIVPGIPVSIGATAYAGIPLTYPEAGDALVLVRGHEDEAGRVPDLDWESLSRLDGTWACYAAGRLVPAILQQLVEHGVPADSPAALVFNGTRADAAHGQRHDRGASRHRRLRRRRLTRRCSSLARPTGLREHLRWFDERPLFGRRVVVTRSQEQAHELVERLENAGAQAILAPTFRLTPAG